MKLLKGAIAVIVVVALIFPLLGKDKHHSTTRTNTQKHDISNILGKPTLDATVEGFHMKVWIMTQKKHKSVMKKDMAHVGMPTDKETLEAMMAGTHHIMLDVTEIGSGMEITDMSAKVLIVYPSKKNSAYDLKPMMSDFGGALTLREKGEYQFTIVVRNQGVPKSKQFMYWVK
jgi:hypothetical protein